MKAKILGRKYGRLTVIQGWGKDKNRNALWLCQCKCGGITIQRTNTLNMGLVKSCGCYLREVNSKNKMAEKNPMWKGDKVSKVALHTWIKNRKPKPKKCEICKKNKPHDLVNISKEYRRDPDDYEWICRRCHMVKDGRINRRSENGQFVRS